MKLSIKWIQVVPVFLIVGWLGRPIVAQTTFDDSMRRQLELDVTSLMAKAKVPGASIAIVQNGQIVYEHGFGVRELGKPGRVNPATLMMIGSTGKSMTTMMMAVLIDDGKESWDTPAKEIYPEFAVSDGALNSKLTLRDLVCNCTGIQRHDLEMQFATRPRSAEDVIRVSAFEERASLQ